MKQTQVKPVNSSRAFKISELFFSTTDRKGIITGFNDVFPDIAAYQPEDLLGKPHNVIRHPDMPRCVFKLLWDYLLSEKSVGAYVKNMAQTGEYYWVFALAMPIEEGFLSIRLKPTSEVFSIIENLYQKLQQCEKGYGKDWRNGMHQAQELLEKSIRELGFESYDAFMAHALREEIKSRKELLATDGFLFSTGQDPLHAVFNDIESLNELRNNLGDRRVYFGNLGYEITRIALNASIAAARLSEAGRALCIISEEISRVATEIASESSSFTDEVNLLSDTLGHTSFLVAFCTLVLEMVEFFQETASVVDLQKNKQTAHFRKTFEQHSKILNICYQQALHQCSVNVFSLQKTLGKFDFFTAALSRILLNLQLGYVTGRSITVETDRGARFSTLLDDLLKLSEEARGELASLKQSVKFVDNLVSRWKSSDVFSLAAKNHISTAV